MIPEQVLKVVLIEDENIWRDKFERILSEFSGLSYQETFKSVHDFLIDVKINKNEPKLIFLDINLDGEMSISYIPKIKKVLPTAEIVMYTIYEDEDMLMRSFMNGATGYIVKSATIADFKCQIEGYKNGGAFLSPNMARKIILSLNPSSQASSVNLTTKEMQILKLLAQGREYKEISRVMNMKINTLRYYIKKIYKALEVNNRVQAINSYNQIKDS